VWYDFGAGDREITIRRSPSESARFGWTVGRLDVPIDSTVDAEALATMARASGCDVVVARFSAEHADWFARFVTTGATAIAAGTLMFWRRTTATVDVSTDPRRCRAEELDEVTQIVGTTFAGYVSHHSANPLLGGDATPSGYAEWLGSYVGQDSEQAVLLVGPDYRIAGFAAVDWTSPWAEIALAGVAPSFQRQGWYSKLLDACTELARSNHRDQLVISTQASNVGVQSAWASKGFRPIAALDTVHLCFGDAADELERRSS
jgi:ribosomal protein S18 acetylase RimI-like enzyme